MVVLAYLLGFVVLLSFAWAYVHWRRFSHRARTTKSIVTDDVKATGVRIGAASLVGGLATSLFALLVASPLGPEKTDILMRVVSVLLCAGLLPLGMLITFFTHVATLHFLYRDHNDAK